MNIPDRALSYILLQRTQYSLTEKYILPGRKVHSFLPPGLFRMIIALEARIRKNALKRIFEADMRAEYESIKDHVPHDARAILDVGSGMGGVDILLYHHYPKKPHLYLLDKSAVTSGLYYGFEKEASYYNSLSLAQSFLSANGVAAEHIHTQEVNDAKTIDFETRFDLIISLLSWGFHYPISTYLDTAYDHLAPNGVMILDIRKGHGSEDELRTKFGNLEIISQTHKTAKVKVRKTP